MLATEESVGFILKISFLFLKVLVAQLLISIGHMNVIKLANDTITS